MENWNSSEREPTASKFTVICQTLLRNGHKSKIRVLSSSDKEHLEQRDDKQGL